MIRFDRITKRYPGVVALDEVSFEVQRATCHALVGENGAGKSTLGKILAGIVRPDDGRILLDDKELILRSPADAKRHGIAIVHQELLFCEHLSVAENLFLAEMPTARGVLDGKAMIREAERALAAVGASFDPRETVGSLSISKQQLVQIAAALNQGARILVFDEPTSSLTSAETDRLLELIRNLVKDGVTCLYVSHRLEEIFAICQYITVLRDGKHIRTTPASETSQDEVVHAMIGRELEEDIHRAPDPPTDQPFVQVEGLTRPGLFEDVSFEIRRGEILGLAGLVGSGRSEVAETLFGLHGEARGTVRLGGRTVTPRTPAQALANGIGLIPEDRKRHGLVLTMSVAENVSLPILRRLSPWGVVRTREETALTRDFIERLRIRTPSEHTVVAHLSGGNQQKVVLAKWLAANCDFLLIDEPTRGVDVGAKAEIHELIRSLAREGKAILLISSDMPELFALCHRLLVLREGRAVGELPRSAFSPAPLLRLMTGLA